MHEFLHIRPPSTHVVAGGSVYYKGDLQKNILFGWTVVFLNRMNNDALIRASLWGKLLQKHILFGILKSEGSAIKMHMRLEFIILTPFASDSGLEEDAEPSLLLLYARPGCHKSTAVTGIWVQATFDSFQMEWQFSQLQDSLAYEDGYPVAEYLRRCQLFFQAVMQSHVWVCQLTTNLLPFHPRPHDRGIGTPRYLLPCHPCANFTEHLPQDIGFRLLLC